LASIVEDVERWFEEASVVVSFLVDEHVEVSEKPEARPDSQEVIREEEPPLESVCLSVVCFVGLYVC